MVVVVVVVVVVVQRTELCFYVRGSRFRNIAVLVLSCVSLSGQSSSIIITIVNVILALI